MIDLDELEPEHPYRTAARPSPASMGGFMVATGGMLDALARGMGLPPRVVETDDDYRHRLTGMIREIGR